MQTPNIPEKPPNTIPPTLDPIQALVQQMGGLQSLQQRLPSALPTTLQGGTLPTNLQQPVVPGLTATLPNDLPGLPMTNLQGGLSLPPRPTPLGAVDPLSASNENDPIKNLLRQLQNQKQQQTQQLDSLWQQNHFQNQPPLPQWQQQQQQQPQPEVSIPPLWDLQPPIVQNPATSLPAPVSSVIPTTTEVQQQQETPKPIVEKETPKQPKEEQQQHQLSAKELKKKREQEEKQAKKEQEEKRKQEQKRLEMEKKAAEEKKRKEEERVRKELEKAKREAEEKRMRELEEKRRLKEQRKQEEARKKAAEEQRRQEEVAERAR